MLLTKNAGLSTLLLFAAKLTAVLAAPVQASAVEAYHILDHRAGDNALTSFNVPQIQDLHVRSSSSDEDSPDLLTDEGYAPGEYNWEHEDNIMESIRHFSHHLPHLLRNIRDHAARHVHGIVESIKKHLKHREDRTMKNLADGGDSFKVLTAPIVSSDPTSRLPVHGDTIRTQSKILQGENQLDVGGTDAYDIGDPVELIDSESEMEE